MPILVVPWRAVEDVKESTKAEVKSRLALSGE